MKIAEYIDIPMTERAGGVGTYIKSITNEFLRLGHSVTIIDGLNRPKIFSNRHLINLCKDADIHHFHEPSTALLFQNLMNFPIWRSNFVVTFHAPISSKSIRCFYNFASPFLYANARLVLTSTKRNVEYMRLKGIRIKVIPLWADPFFSPSSKDIFSRESYLLSVCICDRYHSYKNFPMLSKIGKILREKFGLSLVHVGIHDFDIPYVQHYGVVDLETLRGLYQKALALVLPSIGPYEGFGIVAAESLACGTPVLVSDWCGISEYLNVRFVSSLKDFLPNLCDMVSTLLEDPRPFIDLALRESLKFTYKNCKKTAELILASADSELIRD